MKISEKEVLHVAHLARLTLDESELSSMTSQLDTILQYMDTLKEIDTSGVEPATHALAEKNAFRSDIPKNCLTQKDAVSGSCDHSDEFFVIPRVLEK